MRKVSKAVYRLMFEAYRRNDMADSYEKGKLLRNRWLGLGTYSVYRPVIDAGLMQFHDGCRPPARCLGWLVLTEKGIELFNELSPELGAVLANLKKNTNYLNALVSQYSLICVVHN